MCCTRLAGKVTRQLADCQLADWTSNGLDNSRTGQVADWKTRGCHRRLCVLSFPFWRHLRYRELSSPRVGVSASCPVTAGNTGRENDAKNRYLRTIAQLCRAVSLQPRHYRQSEKNLLNSNISSIRPHNMVNFGH